jgi:tRNA (adenine57-N1/adenine58-N1)-methyltransferase
LEHRDVCSDGFDSRLEKCVDAVFLDLPKPWDALPHATKVLKSSGRICLFSPCIEQVQQNCKSLEEHGFQSIQTMETLVKSYSVLLDAKGAKSPISLFQNKQEEAEEETTTTTTTEKQESHKRQRDTSDDAADLQPTSTKRAVRRRNKKGQAYIQTVNDGDASSDAAHAPYQVKGTRPDQPTASQLVGNERTQRAKLPIQNPVKDEPLTLQHSPLLRGHTGYLTFAVWR